jgi:hypothetical protein
VDPSSSIAGANTFERDACPLETTLDVPPQRHPRRVVGEDIWRPLCAACPTEFSDRYALPSQPMPAPEVLP